MVKAYEDLNTSWGLARFYGDSIFFTDKNLRITLNEIQQIKIRFFRITLILKVNSVNKADSLKRPNVPNKKVKIDFNKKLVQYLDPNYFPRLLVILVLSISAFLLSFIKLDFQYMWACIFYSLFNGLLAYFFFKTLKKSLERSFFLLSSIYAILNLPLLLYLPLSPLFWILFVSIYSITLSLGFLFRNNLFTGGVFAACMWILLSISSYNWLITIIKLTFDSSLGASLQQEVDFKVNRNQIVWDQITWKKPITWDWDQISSWHSFIFGREIIFQVQPIQPVTLLHSPEQSKLGWLSFSQLPVYKIFPFISGYLENQKQLIWAKFLNKGEIESLPISTPNQSFKAYIQSYLFFDFSTRKETILHFMVVSLKKTAKKPKQNPEKYHSLIWCIKQNSEKSMEYTFHQILKGILF